MSNQTKTYIVGRKLVDGLSDMLWSASDAATMSKGARGYSSKMMLIAGATALHADALRVVYSVLTEDHRKVEIDDGDADIGLALSDARHHLRKAIDALEVARLSATGQKFEPDTPHACPF